MDKKTTRLAASAKERFFTPDPGRVAGKAGLVWKF
jgi:hypothetical protein